MPNCACTKCSKVHTVPAAMIGKRGRCASCQTVFVLREIEPLTERTPFGDEMSGLLQAVLEDEENVSPAQGSTNRAVIVRDLPARPALETLASFLIVGSNIAFVLSIACVVGLAVSVDKRDWFTAANWLTGVCALFGSGVSARFSAELLLVVRAVEQRLFEMSCNSRKN